MSAPLTNSICERGAHKFGFVWVGGGGRGGVQGEGFGRTVFLRMGGQVLEGPREECGKRGGVEGVKGEEQNVKINAFWGQKGSLSRVLERKKMKKEVLGGIPRGSFFWVFGLTASQHPKKMVRGRAAHTGSSATCSPPPPGGGALGFTSRVRSIFIGTPRSASL